MSTTIQEKIKFNTTPERLYQALTDPKKFSDLTGAPAEIHSEEGGSFSCFGGMIAGRMIELIPNKRIVQAWRAGNWVSGVYSIVNFELFSEGENTLLYFNHIGFPEGQGEHLKQGWEENYWKPLKNM